MVGHWACNDMHVNTDTLRVRGEVPDAYQVNNPGEKGRAASSLDITK